MNRVNTLIKNIYRINITLFGVNLLIQLSSLNYIYNVGYTILLKEKEVALSGAFIVLVIVINVVVFLLTEVYNNVNGLKLVYGNLMALLPTVISLSSIVTSVWFIQALLSITDGFKDSINLPFKLVVKYNWSLSERIQYLRDILEKQAVPEPVDFELRVRELTGGMDSVRELAVVMERLHAEELRARVFAKGHDLTDIGSSGLLNDVNNWIHAYQWELLVGALFVLGFGLLASYNTAAISKIETDLAIVKKDIIAIDNNVLGLIVKDSEQSSELATLSNLRPNGLIDINTDLILFKNMVTPALGDHLHKILKLENNLLNLEKSTNSKLEMVTDIHRALLKSGSNSLRSAPYPSSDVAIHDLSTAIFNNQEILTSLRGSINANTGLINSLSAKVDAIPVEQVTAVVNAISESGL